MLPYHAHEGSEALGEIEQEYQLRLAEAVSVHCRNTDTLERAVVALYKKASDPKLLERAIKMVESFCSQMGIGGKSFGDGSSRLRMKDDRMMKRIFLLVKDLSSGKFEGHAMCRSFARICTSFENCDTHENMRLVATCLLRSIISASKSVAKTELRAFKRDLGCIIGRMGSELGSIALL